MGNSGEQMMYLMGSNVVYDVMSPAVISVHWTQRTFHVIPIVVCESKNNYVKVSNDENKKKHLDKNIWTHNAFLLKATK
jgi:hypothetical protein